MNNDQSNRKQFIKELLIAFVLAIAIAFIQSIPYLLGHLTAADGLVYTGLIMNPEDSNTYWAKMLQGFSGEWLYTIPFTPEAHDGALVGVFYVWLGQAARWLGISLTAVWHTSRLIAAVILFLTIFIFISAFIQNRRMHWTAYLLTLFGSGLGWLLFIFQATYWLDAFPIDFKQPGAHIFFTTMTFPHITIGTACILVSMWSLHKLAFSYQVSGFSKTRTNSQFTIRNSLFIILLANLSNLLLGIAYPFLLYLVIGTAVITWLILTIQSRTILWKQGLLFAATCIIPAPLYVYFAYTLQTNAVFAAWDAQAGTPSAPWPHYIVAFAPYLLLAGILWWKRPSSRQQYLIFWSWLLVVMLLLYAPLGPQRRFLQGVHVPVSILASIGLIDVVIPRLTQTNLWQRIAALPRYETPKMIRLLLVLFLLVMSISNLYLWADVTRTAVIIQPYPLFRYADEADAVQWLHANAPRSSIVLGDYQTGNFIAARSGQRVMLGHWAETVDVETKQAVVNQFFNADTSDTWRIEQLTSHNVDYVWHGPQVLNLGDFAPSQADYLSPVYVNDSITIYAVEP